MPQKIAEKPAPKPAKKATAPMRHLYLVDGSGFIFRAFHALPPLSRPDGTPVGAVLGFCNMLMKLLNDTDCDGIAVIFDTARKTFRNAIYDQYKAHRPEPPPDLVPQFALVRDATRAFNVSSIEQDGFEADDLIATYACCARDAGAQVTIVSSDKDLMQLVGPGIGMLDPIKQRAIGPVEVMEKFGVPPEKVIDVQALAGDSTDNVPGVPGIGVDTASQLIGEFGSVEELLTFVKDTNAVEKELPKRIKQLEGQIYKLAGHEFPINSSKELGKLLFDELKLPGGKKGKGDAYTINAETLQVLAAKGHKIAEHILRWRVLGRVPTSYAAKLIENEKLARVSKQLVTLDCDVKNCPPLDELVRKPIDREKLLAYLSENQFRTLLQRLQNGAGKAAPTLAKTDGATAQTPAAELPAPAAMHAPGLPSPTADLPPIDRSTYELVQDMAALKRWIAEAEVEGLVAIAAEASSVNPMRAEMIGMSLSLGPNRACYIPLSHNGGGGKPGEFNLGDGSGSRPKQIPLREALDALQPLLANPSVLKIGHDLKAHVEVLARHDVAVSPIDDTMLVSYVLDGGKNSHDMEDLSGIHLSHLTIKYDDLCGSGRDKITFDNVAMDKALEYAAEGAECAWRLHRTLKPRLVTEKMVMVYESIERPLVGVVADMERAGVLVDRTELARLSKDFGERLAELEKQIHKLGKGPFNIGSPKQLGEVLFDKLGLPGGEKTKTGAYATGSEVLEPLAAGGHDIAQRVLDWRQLAKLKSTYADALVEQINPDTGRVHTSFALAATNTGRLSSTDPNLQNIPIRTEEGRKIRKAFVARKGYRLLSVDYSQIELRLVAEIAGIEALQKAFRDGVDIHALTASQVFGVPMKGMDPQVRRKAKAINFGIIYGISGFGLGQQIGVSPGEANAYIKAYLDRYAGIRQYMDKMKSMCHARGYVETLFGRKCHIPGANDRNMARRNFAERQAINAPIQGTAADIIKRAMIRVAPALKKAKLDAAMLLQVHDELLFEVREDHLEETSALVRGIMEKAPEPVLNLSVPLVAEAGSGKSWAEAH